MKQCKFYTYEAGNLDLGGYLGVTVAKQRKDRYDKNVMSLRKKSKKISKNGKISHLEGSIGLK